MALDPKVQQLWQEWNNRFPCPLGEDNIRAWMIRFCQQCNFSFPGEGYATKSADKNRPVSKDTVSKIFPAQAALAPEPNDVKTGMTTWDMVQGAGTTNPRPIFSGQTEHDTSAQWFRKVDPVNHLGVVVPIPPIPVPPAGDRAFLLSLQGQINNYLANN